MSYDDDQDEIIAGANEVMALQLECDEFKQRVNDAESKLAKLRSIMQYQPGLWSDESRLRSLAENLGVANPNTTREADAGRNSGR